MQEVSLTPQPLLLNMAQAQKVLSLGRTKIYELIAKERLPVIHIGRAVRIPYEPLQQWLRERQEQDLLA